MDNIKWGKYLRIDKEPAQVASEQEDNMKFYGKFVLHRDNILDVGCGKGMLVDWLRTKGKEAFGVAISESDIKRGIKQYNFGDSIITIGDMHELPYNNKIFDAIHCKDTYEHAIAPFIAMCEFNRVLTIGGFCFIVIPGEEWIHCDYHYSLFNEVQMKEMFYKCNFLYLGCIKSKPPKGNTIFSCYSAIKQGDIKL